ncbi:MAG TPA: glycosyltransferase [Verrucomicrobiae bacterium]
METAEPLIPRTALLVHGGASSVEAIRACGLAQGLPADRLLFLYREGNRAETYARWEKAIAHWKPDLLYLLNTAMPGCALALKLRWLKGVPYLLDTGDVIYEMAQSAGTTPWWKIPALGVIEELTQASAAGIIVRGSKHREHLSQAGYAKVHLIRDGCSPAASPSPEAVLQLKKQLRLDAPLIVGLMGSLTFSPSLQICYGWDMVEALAQLPEGRVQCVIIGDGNGRTWLEEKARRLGVWSRIRFCGRIPYEQVPLYLRVLDVALSTQTNNLAGQVRTTGKLPEYMAAGCYILASRVGDAEVLLPRGMTLEYHGAVDSHYPARLAARIQELLAHPEQLQERETLPALAQRFCSYDRLAGQFKEVLKQAVKASGR